LVVELERRNFLRGRFKREPDVIRPPFAIVEQDFLSLCEHCPECASSCEQNIIVIGETGTPGMFFDRGECTFCGDCATACKTGALDKDKARPWMIKAKIADNCLSLNAVFCRTCGDNCEEEAINFKLMTGGRSRANVDEELCTGCGACVFVCPSKSIHMLEDRPSQASPTDGGKLHEGRI